MRLGGGGSREVEADWGCGRQDVGQLLGDLTLKWAGGPLSRCADSRQSACFTGCEIGTLPPASNGEAVWVLGGVQLKVEI